MRLKGGGNRLSSNVETWLSSFQVGVSFSVPSHAATFSSASSRTDTVMSVIQGELIDRLERPHFFQSTFSKWVFGNEMDTHIKKGKLL